MSPFSTSVMASQPPPFTSPLGLICQIGQSLVSGEQYCQSARSLKASFLPVQCAPCMMCEIETKRTSRTRSPGHVMRQVQSIVQGDNKGQFGHKSNYKYYVFHLLVIYSNYAYQAVLGSNTHTTDMKNSYNRFRDNMHYHGFCYLTLP